MNKRARVQAMAADRDFDTSESRASEVCGNSAGSGVGEPRSASSLLVALAGSVCWTAGSLWLCGTPTTGRTGWPEVLARATTYLLVAAAAHFVAIRVNRRLFPAVVEAPPGVLWRELWPAVVWLPLLVLLLRESSPLVLLLPAVMVAFALSALRTWVAGGGGEREETSPIFSLFRPGDPRRYVRVMAPAAGSSAAWHGMVAALARDRELLAGVLLAAGATYPLWRWMQSRTAGSEGRRRTLPLTAIVFFCLCVALLPYLRSPHLGSEAQRLLGARGAQPSPAPAVPARAPGPPRLINGTYSGVVLLTPRKKERELVLPSPPSRVEAGAWTERDRVIPFDGVYWYFKQPDVRPRPDAPVVNGDPTERDVRSTDSLPLQMEARQPLQRPLQTGCCRGIAVTVLNADGRPGRIAVELRLHVVGERESVTRFLGERVLRTSEQWNGALARYPQQETLQFLFSRVARGLLVDEIAVVIRPAPERAQAGAHVAVRSFALLL